MINQADSFRFGDGGRARRHRELAVDRRHLALGGLTSDHQLVGDPLERQVSRQVRQESQFGGGQGTVLPACRQYPDAVQPA